MLLVLALIFLLAGMLGGPANGFDLALIEWTAGLRAKAPGLALFAASFTNIGGAIVTLGVSAIAALWLLAKRRPGRSLLLVGTVLSERFFVDGLKYWAGRPRPALEPLLYVPQSLSYPSAHAANSVTAFLAVALLASPVGRRWTTAVAALILGFLIGCSRVLLGVHWPTDVIGGWASGLLAVGLALLIGERSGLSLLESQHDVVRRHRLSPDQQEAP